jgi:hypothetical protein
VAEIGRIGPKTVSELMEIANRFADGEYAYNNKRARSLEGDGSSRQRNQRRRSHNEDDRTRRNQVAARYNRGYEEENENREYQGKSNRRREKTKYSDPSVEDILHGPCHIHYTYLEGKRVSNHLMRDSRTFLRFQDAMELSRGAQQGNTAHGSVTTDQGYQVQSDAGHTQSKGVHIRNDPACPKI